MVWVRKRKESLGHGTYDKMTCWPREFSISNLIIHSRIGSTVTNPPWNRNGRPRSLPVSETILFIPPFKHFSETSFSFCTTITTLRCQNQDVNSFLVGNSTGVSTRPCCSEGLAPEFRLIEVFV